MGMMVVDTSVVIAVITDEPERQAILNRTRGARILATTAMPFEIVNALSANLKKKKVTPERARIALALFQSIKLEFVECDLAATLTCCERFNLYAYDAFVLTTATRMSVPLFTLDRRMRQVALDLGVKCVELSE
jgi:predicted nucleic acid-binding protein